MVRFTPQTLNYFQNHLLLLRSICVPTAVNISPDAAARRGRESRALSAPAAGPRTRRCAGGTCTPHPCPGTRQLLPRLLPLDSEVLDLPVFVLQQFQKHFHNLFLAVFVQFYGIFLQFHHQVVGGHKPERTDSTGGLADLQTQMHFLRNTLDNAI